MNWWRRLWHTCSNFEIICVLSTAYLYNPVPLVASVQRRTGMIERHRSCKARCKRCGNVSIMTFTDVCKKGDKCSE